MNPGVTPRLPQQNIVRLAPMAHNFVFGDLVRTSQGVTHPSNTLTRTRLTAEFQESTMRVAQNALCLVRPMYYL